MRETYEPSELPDETLSEPVIEADTPVGNWGETTAGDLIDAFGPGIFSS